MSSKKISTSVRLDPEVFEVVKHAAEIETRSIGFIVARAVKIYFGLTPNSVTSSEDPHADR